MSKGEKAIQTLENMFFQMKPKFRYTSQSHIEEYTDSIYKQIINGDLQVSRSRMKIPDNPNKNKIEEMLRQKFLTQAQRQKYELQHRLDYLSNSINSMQKYQSSNNRYPKSLRQSYSVGTSRMRQHQWRQRIKEREQDLKKIKQQVSQKKHKRQEELKDIQEKLKVEEQQKKKQVLLERMKQLQQKMKNREDEIKAGNQRVKQVKKQRSVHEKLSDEYNSKELSFLEERKKKLAQIRNIHSPIDQNQIKQHEQRFLELKRQKEEMREREKRMNQSRSNSYRPSYESSFYKKLKDQEKMESENPATLKAQKMKQFYQHVKEHFVPEISEKKRDSIIEIIEKEKKKEDQRNERDQKLQVSRTLGLNYLQGLKKLPKKKKKGSIQEIASKTDRIVYENYLTHKNRGDEKQWHKILNSSDNKETKALQLQFQSQKLEEQLKRKELQIKVMKKDDTGQIDQEYFNMIKAKLDLLQSK